MSILTNTHGKFLLSGPFDADMPYYYLIITDVEFWVKHETELYAWMEENLPRGKSHHEGMVISLDTEEDALAFLLKWA